MYQLLAEWLIGGPTVQFETEWMKRGTELEPEARLYYEMQTDEAVEEVGFICTDDGLRGCSPDGLVGEYGGLEIKVPAPHTHMEYLIKGRVPNDYIPQVQGCLMLTDREWWDFLSYSPGLPPILHRVERDGGYIADLRSALDEFVEKMLAARDKLRADGYEPAGEATPEGAT
jgi:hypothetical protein